MQTLENKVAIVTGGARGIGKAISVRFAAEGAQVVIAQRSSNGIEETLDQIAQNGGAAKFIPTDVRVQQQVDALIQETRQHFGGVNVLVNNAAIPGTYVPFLELPLASWQEMIDVDLTGVFLCSQAAARVMAEQKGGSIINMSSIDGIVAEAYAAHYNAAKGGVNMLTRSMAVDLAPHNIRVNAIAPGPILTEKARDSFSQERWQSAWARIPLKRPGRPEEVAAVAVFLASDDSSFVHGHVLTVDGGYLAA